MKNFKVKENDTDFTIFPFSTIYSFDDPEDQLAVLKTIILDSINRDAPLKRIKFTRLVDERTTHYIITKQTRQI